MNQDVGQYSPNAWGFLDMHVNVKEMVADNWKRYDSNAVTDPLYTESWGYEIFRGGNVLGRERYMFS